MAKTYSIVEGNASAFANNRSIKFPRFQRKQTWDETDNFKLCISVFKGYPIGVVIINSQNKNDYLLDGRQRRNALKLMKDDPKAVYVWAQKYVGFKSTEDPEEVKDKFWKKIDNYLQHDAAKIKASKKGQNENENIEEENEADQVLTDEDKENAFDFEKQYTSLQSLLELVLLCHPMRNEKTNLQKMFEFNNIIPIQDLDYSEPCGAERKVSSIKLKKYIDDIISEEINTANLFIESLIRRYKLNANDSKKISNYINQHWDYYAKAFDVFQKVADVIDSSSIGIITLINADILDAQNIFSLVNGSGTPLSAEELLSARPFWNIDLDNPSSELLEKRKEMYKFLDIDLPENACRWDLAATLLQRIDKNSLIFAKKNLSFTTSISLSFRLISGFFVKGINNTSITALEKAAIDWEVDIEKRIEEINTVISLLEDIKLFKTMMAWGQSIMDLTSNSIAIEYCCLMHRIWKDLGCPIKSSSTISQFNRKAVYLFDKLVYEYSIRMWSGSGDSTVASHLKDYSLRFNMISEKEWCDFIDEIDSGQYKGKQTTTTTLKPFIFYHYFLRDMLPTLKNTDTKYEVDHLVAQSLFTDNNVIDQRYKNNYLNFSVLPKGDNIEKTNKRLNEITDSWLIEQIKKYAMIEDSDFKTLSDLSNVSELSNRKKVFKESYITFRNKLIANL